MKYCKKFINNILTNISYERQSTNYKSSLKNYNNYTLLKLNFDMQYRLKNPSCEDKQIIYKI